MLLEKAINAHRGKVIWENISYITANLRIKGNILATRFKSPVIRNLTVKINCKQVHTEITPFPKTGFKGVFTSKYVQIEDLEQNIKEKQSLNQLFNGKTKLPVIWNDLHVLYFFGYAFWNYLMTPYLFLWPGFSHQEIGIWQEKNGSIWHKLLVNFPDNIPTHSKQQVFYFDESALLQRLDYTAEIFGSFTKGAHYCFEHKEFEGLSFPTYRKVFTRLPNNQPLKLFGVMEGWIDKITADFDNQLILKNYK